MLGTLGSKVGIVSGDDHRVVVDLERVRLDGVACSDNDPEPRTPKAILGLLLRIGANPQDTTFVSGRPDGVRAGMDAGVETIGIGPAMQDVVDLRKAGAGRVVSHVTDIVAAVQ